MSKRNYINLDDEKLQTHKTYDEIEDKLSKKLKTSDNEQDIKNNNATDELMIKEFIVNYIPPLCEKCKKRKVDRVCMNRQCGFQNNFNLICSSCHSNIHTNSSQKSYLDLEEFFQKLNVFVENKKNTEQQFECISVKLNLLNNSLSEIEQIRKNLGILKQKLLIDILGYTPLKNQVQQIEESLIKAITSCNQDKINEILKNIKKIITFEENTFSSIDLERIFKKIEVNLKCNQKSILNIEKIVSTSYEGFTNIDLNNLELVPSLDLQSTVPHFIWKHINNEIQINNSTEESSQYYLNLPLSTKKKYIMRFRFEIQPIKPYVIIGLLPSSKVNNQWVFGYQNHFFCKRFYSCYPQGECSRIIKGIELSTNSIKGTQIELRVDFKNNYVDFTDFPNHYSINANHTNNYLEMNETYYFIFQLFSIQSIAIESIKEVLQLEILS